jgi:hypothetical protein
MIQMINTVKRVRKTSGRGRGAGQSAALPQPHLFPDRRQRISIEKAASRWRKAISPLEEKVITALTRKSMKRFGYFSSNHPVYRDL